MTSSNELHVVYGTGPVGTAVIETLVAQGKPVRVVTRSGVRKHLPPSAEVVRGDATDPADARQVCAHATHVYTCTNPVDYHRWPEQFPPLQRGVLAGAAAHGAKLIVMENLYMYGPHDGVPMTETMPMHGRGRRSTTRVRMTEELFAAHRSGQVRVVSVRASDLFGPHVTQSLVGAPFFAPLLRGKPAQLFANLDVPHSLSYVRDVGAALVRVGADDRALGRAWHAPNAPAIPLRAFARLLGDEAGITPRLRALPRTVTRACCRSWVWPCRHCGGCVRTSTSCTSRISSITAPIRRHSATMPRPCARRSAKRSPGIAPRPQRTPTCRSAPWPVTRLEMEMKHQTSAWRFWGAWMLAFLGFPVAGLAGIAVAGPVTTPLDGVLGGVAAGAVIGLAQWLVLRQRLSLSPRWIAATAAGMGAGLALSITLLGTATEGMALPLRGLVTGAAIGSAQWLVLRASTDRAAAWVPVVALGWALGWIIMRATGIDLAPGWYVFGAYGALTFQVLTGLALGWLLQGRERDMVLA